MAGEPVSLPIEPSPLVGHLRAEPVLRVRPPDFSRYPWSIRVVLELEWQINGRILSTHKASEP